MVFRGQWQALALQFQLWQAAAPFMNIKLYRACVIHTIGRYQTEWLPVCPVVLLQKIASQHHCPSSWYEWLGCLWCHPAIPECEAQDINTSCHQDYNRQPVSCLKVICYCSCMISLRAISFPALCKRPSRLWEFLKSKPNIPWIQSCPWSEC